MSRPPFAPHPLRYSWAVWFVKSALNIDKQLPVQSNKKGTSEILHTTGLLKLGKSLGNGAGT